LEERTEEILVGMEITDKDRHYALESEVVTVCICNRCESPKCVKKDDEKPYFWRCRYCEFVNVLKDW
jgi:hypothetical protein